MSLKSELNGTFTLGELDRLMFPVAWNGTMPDDEAEAQETEMRDLVREAKDQLQAYYNEQGDGESDYAVQIEGGEVVEIVTEG